VRRANVDARASRRRCRGRGRGDVRHRHALGVQEALEEQVVAQRVDAMRNDLVAALHAGVPPAELARLAAVGRPTLYRLRRSS